MKYAKIESLVKKFMKHLKNKEATFLPSNHTRGLKNVKDFLVKMRKEIHFTDVLKSLQEYKSDDGNVHICVNDESGGQKLLLYTLINFWGSNWNKRNKSRTPADAIPLTGILLSQENRHAISLFLANKHSRQLMDQAIDPSTALFEQLLIKFNDITFNNIDRSNKMDDVDINHSINPNFIASLFVFSFIVCFF